MIESIYYYITGLLFTSGVIIIWNFSSISIHLLSWLYKDKFIVTIDDLFDAISEKHPNIAELLFCPMCLGFWLSLATSAVIFKVNQTSPWFIPVSAFSWPLFIFITYKLLDKK